MEIKTVEKANEKRKLWTPEQYELLGILVETGKHPKEIGSMLGRTEGAIRVKMSERGLYTRQPKDDSFPPMNDNTQGNQPVNQQQLGFMFAQMEDMYARSRSVAGTVNEVKSFLLGLREKATETSKELKQAQRMITASLALNTTTLGVIAWIILS